MADIFKEVDEAIREERFGKLWKKYGRHMISVAVAVVLGVAGIQGWSAYDLDRRSGLSDRYSAALGQAAAGDTAAALNALLDLADAGGDGYAGLAAFERARVLADSGDIDGARAVWDRIAESSELGPAFRGAAVLLSVMHQLDEGDPAALRARLGPLAAEGQAFRATALELLALLALREGDRAAARAHYTTIADDREAPLGIKTRATQMLTALKD